MKPRIRILPAVLLMISGMAFFSCSKSNDPDPVPTPVYPQLLGTWMGYSSQNDTVLFEITNWNGKLNIYRYKYAITYEAPGYYQRVSGDYSGLNILFSTNNSFAFQNGTSVNDSITGTFDVQSMTLAGSIACEFGSVGGKPVVRATYTATKK